MTSRPFTIPSWVPLAAIVAVVLWAVSIWWMVATLPASASSTTTVEEGVSILADDMSTLAARVDELADEVATLREERDTLLQRVADLEGPATTGDAMGVMGDVFPGEEMGLTALAADVTTHPLYTAGKDKFNCRAFSSYEEAQEALRVNGPGDPNKIDTNRNGIACEDIKFATPKATPTPTAPPKPSN
jgi:hypothetical protein